MKKLTLLLFLLLGSISLHAQTKTKPNVVDNVKEIQGANFRLFPTTNMWTFIKLDTRNGLLWQVQYSLNPENRMVTYLNLDRLASVNEEVKDRFTLYPTQNMYNFILLDQVNGKTWQVQWATEYANRGIFPIE
ncbi:hypothetical protein [Aquirufa novilacunae]|jgi:hypothetical protein|uniref:Uncharacterized protein n=1 Tax=Aquirufa novilacunae TaxID=3139305 RepID=A0ABW8U615_9BACT